MQPLVAEVLAARGVFTTVFVLCILWRITFLEKQKSKSRLESFEAADVLQKAYLKRIQRQKEFFAILVHELKTPLYTIALATHSLHKNAQASSVDTVQRINNIAHSVDDANYIIDRCVEADQLEQDEIPVHKTSISLKTLLRELVVLQGYERLFFTGIAEAKLSTDFHHAKIILFNLITNALKYSPPQSKVRVDVAAIDTDARPSLCLRVSNAVGSAGHPDPSKVFSRYYRAEGAKKESGAGLGLWLAESIAQRLGTHLHCTRHEDTVCFYFSLELK